MSKQHRATLTVVSPAIALSEIATLVVPPYVTLADAMSAVLQTLSLLLHSRTLFLARFDSSPNQQERILTDVQVIDNDGCPVTPGTIGPLLQTYCNTVGETREPLVIPDVIALPFYQNMPITTQLGIGSYVGVPLIYSDQRVYGTLCGLDPAPLTFDQTQVETLQILAQFLIMFIERDEVSTTLRQETNANINQQSELHKFKNPV